MSAPTSNLSVGLIIGAIVLTITLFVMRGLSALSVGEFGMASGLEGASIYATRLACTGANVYARLPEDPNVYIFNALFYGAYGKVAALVNCGPNTVIAARIATATAACAAAIIVGLAARSEGCSKVQAIFLATAPLAPVIGWWAFAVRPDVGAFLASIAALAVARRAIAAESVLLVIVATALCALAWAFKQTYLVMAPLVGLYIAICCARAQTRWAALIAAAIVTAAVVILISTPSNYQFHTVVSASDREFSIQIALTNAIAFAVKAAPFLTLGVFVAPQLLTSFRSGKWRTKSSERDWLVLTLFLLGLTAVFAFAAGHFGASDNYYFPVLAVLLAITMQALPAMNARLAAIALTTSAVAAAAVAGIVLVGISGSSTLQVTSAQDRFAFATAMNSLQGKTLVVNDSYALPAYAPNADVRLFDEYLYAHGPAKLFHPTLFEQVRSGRFGGLALEQSSVDKFSLSKYMLIAQIGPMNIYRNIASSSNSRQARQ